MNKKVIAFPFAGGNKHCYDFLKNHLSSQNVEMHTMEYPGRGSRIKESLLVDIYSLIDDLYEKVLCLTDDSNYILFGHSMGGLVAYLLAKKIEQHDDNPPFKLIVSGRTPPSIVKDEEISNLESDVFWNKVLELGGAPKQILEEESLLSFFEPILKADFSIIENYHHTAGRKLQVPIDAFYGDQELTNEMEMKKWRQETTNEFNLVKMKGNHFFINEYGKELAEHFIQTFHAK